MVPDHRREHGLHPRPGSEPGGWVPCLLREKKRSLPHDGRGADELVRVRQANCGNSAVGGEKTEADPSHKNEGLCIQGTEAAEFGVK